MINVLSLVPLSISARSVSLGDTKLQPGVPPPARLLQFNSILDVISEHAALTERVPNGSQVQLPDGQENGRLGSINRFDEKRPLYMATFILNGIRVSNRKKKNISGERNMF